MAITINAKGTSVPQFKIGKGGVSLLHSSTEPTNASQGDVWIGHDGRSPLFYDSSSDAFEYPRMGKLAVDGHTFYTDPGVSVTDVNTLSANKTVTITDGVGNAFSGITATDDEENFILKCTGELDVGVAIVSDTSLAVLKTDDESTLVVRGGNTFEGTGGDLKLVGGRASGAGTDGNVLINNITFPQTDGSADEYLMTDGSGNLSFSDPHSGVGSATKSIYSGIAIDCATTSFATISDGTSAITVSNVPSGAYTLVLRLTSGTSAINLTNFTIKWEGGAAPTYTSDDDIITLVTVDSGTGWFGSATTGHA